VSFHEIVAARHVFYTRARELTSAPWVRNTHDWSPIGAVTRNPERDSIVTTQTAAFDPLTA
jgi:putative transposase